MKKITIFITTAFLIIGLMTNLLADTPAKPISGPATQPATQPTPQTKALNITANISFFYYKNLPGAVDFYQKVMGLQCVLDYGFAKAYRLSESSFLCLVDEAKGMHKTTEPKSVALSFISTEVDGWYKYLTAKGVKMRSKIGNSKRLPIRGFVAYDPEGYSLEFESFLQHDQNKKILAALAKTPTLYPPKNATDSRPKELGVQGNILWLYYKDLKEAQRFYEKNLGLKLLTDQGFAKVYTSSASSFIGLVDETKGMHRFSPQKAVNVGFVTGDVDEWYRSLLEKGLKMRGPLKDAEKSKVRAFVTFDCAGYYLEFDKFVTHESNKALVEILKTLK